MATKQVFAPRLHVLLARDAPYGVVIRRGPSKQVCTIGWNREDDTFQIGQWLKGRIYERRSDLSPDGKHMIYFAMDGRWQSESKGSWTAISKSPYLKAIGFWPQGDCWFGGGLFLDNDTYWLNGNLKPLTVPPLQQIAKFPRFLDYGGECSHGYYLRLLRDGWALKSSEKISHYHNLNVFEKPINDIWLLRKFAQSRSDAPRGKGFDYDQHEIENAETGEKIDGADWEWADIDRHRLVWAEQSKLFAAQVSANGISAATLLYDFNSMVFEPLAAPY